jgi:DNA-binding NarL/FixJ family response regulator
VADERPQALFALEALLRTYEDIEIVGTARDGDEVLRAAARLHPDVVILDLVMPRIDGLQAARRLKARGIPVLLLTMHAALSTSALPATDACLLKGVSGDEIVGAIRRLHAPGAEPVLRSHVPSPPQDLS